MRVLGVDPGTVATGWGVVDSDGRRTVRVASGVIRGHGGLAERLACVCDEIARVLAAYRPACVSLEKSFVGANVQSAFRLGEARGAILVSAARAGVPVAEYSPAQIKMAVAGHGRAGKAQMQAMVGRLLGVESRLATDEADALGAALCHVQLGAFADRFGSVTPRSGGRRAARSAWTRHVETLASDTTASAPSPVGRALVRVPRRRMGRA